ncbi:MAG: hypothetical protein HY763_01500 [Planctomycetes bacterium]|nr:hypothetical protein [Planctomycetota bacterium]
MGLCVTFVSGVRRSGKSAVIRSMVDHLWKTQPHYLRLVKAGSDKHPPPAADKPIPKCGIASARWIEYKPDRVFEILSEVLTAIHHQDRYGSVVIEADADAALRYAYPYDHRVFVMPVPGSVNDVFREPTRAAVELRHVLDDTAAFASEIFGLFSADDGEPHEERPDLTPTQMRGFLHSPLGDELATRIQLKQPYHGLVESEVIIVNTSCGQTTEETAECVRRIERLLERLCGAGNRHADLFFCDPCNPTEKTCKKLLKALKPMCRGGK